MMMRPGDILGRIFFILSQKSIIGIYPRSTRRTRIVGNYPRNYFGSCFARNLWGKSSLKNGRRPEIIYHSASTNKIFNKNP